MADDRVRLSPTHDEAARRLDRLADRLRVIGPRLAARDGDEARVTLAEIRSGLQRIADLAADADGEPRRPVPELAAHGLADQALVLGHDLLGTGAALRTAGTLRPDAVRTAAGVRTDLFRARAVEAFESVIELL